MNEKQNPNLKSEIAKIKNQRNVDQFQKQFELNMNVVLLTIINPIINKKKNIQTTPGDLNIKSTLLSIINA